MSGTALSEYVSGHSGSQLEATYLYMTLSHVSMWGIIKFKIAVCRPSKTPKNKTIRTTIPDFFVVFYTEVDANPFNPSVQKFGRYDDNDDTLSKSLSILSNKDEDIPTWTHLLII